MAKPVTTVARTVAESVEQFLTAQAQHSRALLGATTLYCQQSLMCFAVQLLCTAITTWVLVAVGSALATHAFLLQCVQLRVRVRRGYWKDAELQPLSFTGAFGAIRL